MRWNGLREIVASAMTPFLPKMLYFTFYLMYGMSAPFYPLILSGRVVDDRVVGFTFGVMCLLQLVFAPLWGFVSDITHRPRLLISCLLISSLGVRCIVIVLPRDAPIFAAPLVFVFSEMLFCGCIPVMDGFVCGLLTPTQPFGRQRLFGAISWGASAPLAGVLFANVTLSLEFALLFTWIGSVLVIACLFFASASTYVTTRSHVGRTPFFAALRQTKLSWQQICFFVAVVFAGFSSHSIGTFLFLFLKAEGGSSTLMGFAVLLMIVSEIPLMFFSHKIAAKIGAFSCVLMGLCAYTLRFVGYQSLHSFSSPWMVLVIEPLHGVTFGIFYAVCVSYVASAVATETTVSSFQGLFSGLMSFGRAFGAVGGGYLFSIGGGTLLFRVGAVVMASVSVLFAVVVLTDRGFVLQESKNIDAAEALKIETELMDVFSADEEDEDDDLLKIK
jgi:PPP family 3-phenylpropionic acid transporter